MSSRPARPDCQVVEDRGQVTVAEAPGHRGEPEGLLDPGRPDQRRQLDGVGHLGPHPGGADGGGLHQPAGGALAQGAEGDLGLGLGPDLRRPGTVAAGMVGIVLVEDLWIPGRGKTVADDLNEALGAAAHDDELLAHDPAPHFGALVAVGRRVAHRAEADGLVVAHDPGLTEGRGVSLDRQHVEVRRLLGEHVDRRPAGLAVHPGVEGLGEGVAGRRPARRSRRSSSSRLASVGTRSRLATLTVDSDPPLDSGS